MSVVTDDESGESVEPMEKVSLRGLGESDLWITCCFDITTSDAKGAYTQTDSQGGGGDCLVPKSDTETHLR